MRARARSAPTPTARAPARVRAQVRCLVDVPGEKLPEDLPGYLRTQVAPQLPQQLQPAFLTALETEPIRSMQNKQLTSQPLHQPGASACARGWRGGCGCGGRHMAPW
jgi:squalene monooxygenase